MSKPVFQDLFKFEGRRNRLSYLLVQLSTWLVMAVGILVAAFGIGVYDSGGAAAVGAAALIFIGGVLFIASVLSAWITSAQRTRDIGWPGWVCLFQLTPYVGWILSLVITIAPGDTKFNNKYGASCLTKAE